MNTQAFVLPVLMFLLSFEPSVTAEVFAMAAMAGGGGNFSRYDFWLLRQIERFNPPNEHILILTKKHVESEIGFVYWPQGDEQAGESYRDFYGMVLVDDPGPPSTAFMRFCYDALVSGGKIVFVNGRTVDAIFTKI